MNHLLTLPLWLVAILVILAVWSALDRLLIPSARWFLRRRVNRVLEEINTRLKIEIPPFKVTKRGGPDRPAALRPAGAGGGRGLRARAGHAARGRDGESRGIRPRDRAELQRLRLLPGRLLARAQRRPLSLPRAPRLLRRGGARRDPAEGSTVVFLINHRSNMDYILVGYLAAEKAAISYAVGEWARIWPLQTLVRAMGAYFVRRNSRDALYRKVLERWVAMATEAGVTQAVFPEGGLSRDGRLRPPKVGILDYMLRSFDPAGRAGHRLHPGRHQLRPHVRGPHASSPPATTRAGKSALSPRSERPSDSCSRTWVSWRATAGTASAMRASTSARRSRSRRTWRSAGSTTARFPGRNASPRCPCSRKTSWRRSPRVIPVVPVSLVARAFVADPARSWSELELKAQALDEMRQLEAAGVHVYVPRGDQDYAIDVGLRMLTLRRLVLESGRPLHARRRRSCRCSSTTPTASRTSLKIGRREARR